MVRAVLLTLAVALLAVAPAQAGTISREPPLCPTCPPSVSFQAAPGERNVLTIENASDAVVLRDAGAPIRPAEGCTVVDGGLRCSGRLAAAHLGDGDDVATTANLDSPGRVGFIYGEAGDDRITAGDSTVSGGPGDDVVSGTSILDDDGPTPGHDTYIGVGRTYYSGVRGATLSYATRTDGVRADLRRGQPSEDRISGVWDIAGGTGDDVLVGDDQQNRLIGNEGEDRVVGFGGNDQLSGEAVSAGDGHDEVRGGPGPRAPRCGAGHDVVLADGDSLVGGDCERVGANAGSGARPRKHLSSAGAPFLFELPSCTHSCASQRWEATLDGRVVASASGAAGSLALNARGRRLLRRERVMRVRVARTFMLSGIDNGIASPHREQFRIDLRL